MITGKLIFYCSECGNRFRGSRCRMERDCVYRPGQMPDAAVDIRARGVHSLPKLPIFVIKEFGK